MVYRVAESRYKNLTQGRVLNENLGNPAVAQKICNGDITTATNTISTCLAHC